MTLEHRPRVFEKRFLRRILGAKRDEMTGGWRTLHNEEFHKLHSSPNIIRLLKSSETRWAGRGMHIEYWWESQNERDY
jgi:hypothetical protein